MPRPPDEVTGSSHQMTPVLPLHGLKAVRTRADVRSFTAYLTMRGHVLDANVSGWPAKLELVMKHESQPTQPTPNPYANILKREHDHIMQGIQQLQITANYINLRIKELERGK